MKKTLFALTFAVTAMTFASCAGNKTETSGETVTEAVETVETDKSDLPVLDDAQKKALVASTLVTDADFSKPMFIDFNATWCGPCRQFAPFFEASAEKYSDKAKFVSIDVDVYGDVANAFGVQSIPTVIAISPNGEYVTYVGTQDIIGEGVFDAIVEKIVK